MKQRDVFKSANSWLLIVCVSTVLIGLIGRAHELSIAFVWFDESLSLTVSSLTRQQMLGLSYVSIDSHPPFHYLVLAVIRRLWPNDERSIRLFAVICSIATLVFVYLTARCLMPPSFALLPAALFAVNAIYVFESVAIRGYPILFLSVSMLMFFCFKTHMSAKPGVSDYFWIFATSVIATYTHYFGILALIFPCSLAVARVFERRHLGEKLLDAFSFVCFLAAAVCLPVVWIAYRHSGSVGYAHFLQTQALPLGQSMWLFNWFSLWRPGNGLLEASPIFSQLPIGLVVAIDGIFAVLAALLCLSGIWRMSKHYELRALAFATAVTVAATMMFAVLAGLRVAMVPYYFSHLMPLTSLAGAYFLYSCVRTRQNLLAAFAALVWIAGLAISSHSVVARIINNYSYVYEPNWRDLSASLKPVIAPEDTLVILGWDARPISYYLNHPYITSYQFEQEVKADKCKARYTLIKSHFGRNAVLPAAAKPLLIMEKDVSAWFYKC